MSGMAFTQCANTDCLVLRKLLQQYLRDVYRLVSVLSGFMRNFGSVSVKTKVSVRSAKGYFKMEFIIIKSIKIFRMVLDIGSDFWFWWTVKGTK